MCKKSAIMAWAIAAILTTSILAFVLPNQVFAIIPPLGNQVSGNHQNGIYAVFQQPPQAVQGAASGGQVLAGKVLEGHEAQLHNELLQQGGHIGFDDGTTRPTIH